MPCSEDLKIFGMAGGRRKRNKHKHKNAQIF